jgi:ABC-type transporter Mla MlaB component
MSLGFARRHSSVVPPKIAASMVVCHHGAEVAAWQAQWARCDIAVVDALARLQLAARRLGYAVELRSVSSELLELLDLLGLRELVTGAAGDVCLRLEMRGESESREQVGVEEVVVADDPVA